ncbi:hypothetical protein [Lacimicrobium alkaliphilum]|uniref:Uncharacterized protein n=1 Tax=Lacimicrobium alkaliphilum TaxID=1526571 RepID=A0ABQ1RVZ4_9ALTE|nr:hypothetical protein [Lacimicrobium alkaliphilum]GGD79399.1 hypothetical protein GCM10011357_37980 [Lacimicrobium alkaliphilum]
MKSKTESILVVLFALFSLQVLANNTTITRSEDIGVVRGTITNNNLADIPLMYELSLTNIARVHGFNAMYPLQIQLGDSTYRTCRDFYKDESYTAEEYIAFQKKYAGASVELNGVQRHYGVAGSAGCTFKEFKVLTNGEEMIGAQKEQKQAQPDESYEQANGNYAIGDMAVSVFNLHRGFVHFRLLGKDGMPVKKPNHECAGKAEIKPVLDRDTLFAIRSEIKKMGKKATLKNAQMVDGKCTVEGVVPISQ